MNNPPNFLYKYRNFEDRFMENIIKNSSLYFSQVNNFNDPFDTNLDFKESYTLSERLGRVKYLSKLHNAGEKYKDMKNKAKNHDFFIKNEKKSLEIALDTFSILSLSNNPKNILMWSHYSKNHTGLVFEFQPKYTNSYFLEANKMIYHNDYPLLSFTQKSPIQFEKLFLLKSEDWKYEEEYRIIKKLPAGEFRFNKLELTSIIFGLKTETKNIDMIKKLCTENGFGHIKFRKTERVYGKFELKIVDL